MNTAPRLHLADADFSDGIQYLASPWAGFDTLAAEPVIGEGETAIPDPAAPEAAFQTLLAADALRYLTLQICGSKASGHPAAMPPPPRRTPR